ncbi:unnamed protein product [Litomosoides sigmodontis]|uniref:Uncharacterized protein n=1 Tax=Litomosoides sigmodontis TaxID=42156 RepID=A0A3P6VEG2_LITSI|nr:unnamed protein product [Litomosoides sigmodontis]
MYKYCGITVKRHCNIFKARSGRFILKMSTEDSDGSSTSSGNSSDRGFIARRPFSVSVRIPSSKEEESAKSEKDPEGTFVGDADAAQKQNDAAKNRNTEPNPAPADDASKADVPQRGRSLKKNTVGCRHRGSSPIICKANANVTTTRRRFVGRRRKPAPYSPLKNRHNNVEE